MDTQHDYPFFTHTQCPHFPCHEGIAPEDFNCLFCYCPLYTLGPDCCGDYSYTEKGVKVCTNCGRPHQGDAGTRMVKEHFKKLAELAAAHDTQRSSANTTNYSASPESS